MALEFGSLTGQQLAGADLKGRAFRSCRVARTTLAGADLRNATFDEVEFEDCDPWCCSASTGRRPHAR